MLSYMLNKTLKYALKTRVQTLNINLGSTCILAFSSDLKDFHNELHSASTENSDKHIKQFLKDAKNIKNVGIVPIEICSTLSYYWFLVG